MLQFWRCNSNSKNQSLLSYRSPSIIYGAGAGGGALLIILVILIVMQRRKDAANRARFAAAQSGYSDLLAMSDEFILERARNIQSALMVLLLIFPSLFPMITKREVRFLYLAQN